MPVYPNYYYPAGYQPMQVQPAQTNAQGGQNGIIWVQGEAGAKAYPVAANNSVLLMDTEDSVLYIKTVDSSGMPQPLRIFEYKERTALNQPVAGAVSKTESVTREEFEALREDVRRLRSDIKTLEEENGDG